MHRLTTLTGGWTPDTEGVIFVEQTPASLIFLTSADTDIQSLAVALPYLPSSFPTLRCVNLLQLQQPLSIDHYGETVLGQADVIILRLLGGQSYWSYGLEVIEEIVRERGIQLWVLPGDNYLDSTLMSHSTVPINIVHQFWQYLTEGGQENWINGLKFISDSAFQTNYRPILPQEVPRIGISYYSDIKRDHKVGILFYRSHYLAGNTLPIDVLCRYLIERNLQPIPIFVTSLRDPDIQEALLSYFQGIDIIINTTSFSLAKLDFEETAQDGLSLWKKLNVPILQAIFSSSTLETWENGFQGLTPRDVAMNVALPEVDGRIITRIISFKSVARWHAQLETNLVIYQPHLEGIEFVTALVENWITLKKTPIAERKIVIILANYPNKDGRIANGVGLDTPASCIEVLKALQQEGYVLKADRQNAPSNLSFLPQTGDELIHLLTQKITNDPEGKEYRKSDQSLSASTYREYFKTLPQTRQEQLLKRWGDRYLSFDHTSQIPIAGKQFGNIFIGIQPSRGYDHDPSLNYHAPDLEPTPDYLAYYYWLKTQFNAHAIIHLGKHGNLEWLPGKSLALSSQCYPHIALETLPHFYPFIVNDPGEGSQAKRRSHAVIIDHLTPPLTRADLYGDLAQLETLIDEYYEAQTLDPTRLKVIGERITQLLNQTQLNQDLGIDTINLNTLPAILNLADSYLCDIKAAQIRDGLHILGCCPPPPQLNDLILAIARFPNYNRPGLTQAIAQDFTLDFDPLTVDPTHLIAPQLLPRFAPFNLPQIPNYGDAIDALETYAKGLISSLITEQNLDRHEGEKIPFPQTQKILNWLKKTLIPALEQTSQETTHLLAGLNGNYVPSGSSGAPTRGRPDVLPTGRNFYSVDIRAIPTETAWDLGRKAAELLIERYTQENGEYPKTLAISIWGTSTMRTGGDDVAQVLALLGVQPVWDHASRRVIDFEILAPSVLGRPRVDVTVRISGFFRDSFPNLLHLLQNSIKAVACQEETSEINPLAAQVQTEQAFWQDQGLTKEQANQRATYRIFGSKPGAYGAGLQGLIEAQNWQNDEDLARAYLNWSCYAYDQKGEGHAIPEVFEQRLKNLQIIVHNQDNREHDLLDSDDYYQFQGGLTVATRALTGRNPTVYFGDNSLPQNPKVRLLKEEINRVYRSRVVNPKWIEGVMRHGYKGAFEMAATVDYLFAYDATTHCVEDYLYQGVADAYLFDEKVQQFIQDKNPWALRDMAERLLEAHQRNLWQNVKQDVLDQLRNLVHQGERGVEEKREE